MNSPVRKDGREQGPELIPEDVAIPPRVDASEHPPAAGRLSDESGGDTFSGGSEETVGLEEHHQMLRSRQNREIERLVDGPLPDLSRLDEKDAFIQSQPLTLLIHDAFVQQKENLLDKICHILFISFPGIINVYRSFPLLRFSWPVIKEPNEAGARYLFFIMVVLLVSISSVLWSIMFVRVLEMRDMRYVLLLGLLLAGSLMLQEFIMVGGVQFLKSLNVEW